MTLLPSVLADPRTRNPLLVLQSSAAQSSLPLLHFLISQASSATRTVLFCFLHAPSTLIDEEILKSGKVDALDWTSRVPGYNDNWVNPRQEMLNVVQAAPAGALNVVIDSVDALASDIESVSDTCKIIQELLSVVRTRPIASRLILHLLSPSPLIPLLTTTALSPALTHLTAHPPALLTHLATAYLTPPPPASAPAKFWGVFLPIRDRGHESERLVFGSAGEGTGGAEIVVEVLVRGDGARRGVERVLEGWKSGTCVELTALDSLKSVWTRTTVEDAPPDPTQNVSFNLNLTPSQQQSRAQVPLPYAHEGKTLEKPPTGAIFYDPDSADDIDDDDPDEDLDI